MIKILFLAACLLLVQLATAQTCNDAIPASTPDSRFTVTGDEVTDTATGLVWQRCSLGQTGDDCIGGGPGGGTSNYTWQQALQAAETERVNTGQSWRLPNINELGSIIEEKCTQPASNLAIFPNTQGSYWSASPYVGNGGGYSGSAWMVNFWFNSSYRQGKAASLTVRLVRDGQ